MEMVGNRQHKRGGAKTPKSLSSTALRSLEALGELFGKELSPTDLRIWSGIFQQYSDVAIDWACANWMRNGKFFPKPSEILELIHAFGSSPENQARICKKCLNGWIVVNPEAKTGDCKVMPCDCVLEAISDGKIPTKECDSECKRRHGTGYHTNDVHWLFKRYASERKTNPAVKLTDLMDELDSKRQGGPPEWRKVGGVAAKVYQGEPIRDEDTPF